MLSTVIDSTAEAAAIATLRAEEEVAGVFACTRKERQLSRVGSPYLTIELRDRTGTILARVFRDADVLGPAASSAVSWCACEGG